MVTKREEIIDYALRLIKNRSFSSFSYEDISKELKMTKAAVHYHFEKKEDLGLAVCERLQETLVKIYEQCRNEIKNRKGHPWSFIERRICTIKPDEICPILSLQSDYENLSVKFRERIEKLSMSEIELMQQLVKEYAPDFKAEGAVISALMSVKGSLQYRRILGEKIFIETIREVKKQFYSFTIGEERK